MDIVSLAEPADSASDVGTPKAASEPGGIVRGDSSPRLSKTISEPGDYTVKISDLLRRSQGLKLVDGAVIEDDLRSAASSMGDSSVLSLGVPKDAAERVFTSDMKLPEDQHNRDVRKVILPSNDGSSAVMGALKIKHVRPQLSHPPGLEVSDEDVPEPHMFLGDKNLHEIAMFTHIEKNHRGFAEKYLTRYHGGGTLSVARGSKDFDADPELAFTVTFWEYGVEPKYIIPCGPGRVFELDECLVLKRWSENGHRAVWLLTEFNPKSMSMKEYVKKLLEVNPCDDAACQQRRFQEIGNGFRQTQQMMEELYDPTDEIYFVHCDYHMGNMLVVPPVNSLIYAKGDIMKDEFDEDKIRAFSSERPENPQALLFDLDFSGFLDQAVIGIGRRPSHVNDTFGLVWNLPMLHALPVLDLQGGRDEWLLETLSFLRLEPTEGVEATRAMLHASDKWMGMAQLLEMHENNDETRMAVALAGGTNIRQAFENLVANNWIQGPELNSGERAVRIAERRRIINEQTVQALQEVDRLFAEPILARLLGDGVKQSDEDFKGASFRVKLIVKSMVLERWLKTVQNI